MRTLNDTTDKLTPAVNAAVASGGDCVITLAVDAEQRHTLDYIAGGYYGTPDANSSIVVNDVTSNAVLFTAPVTAAGPFIFPFGVPGLQAPLGSAITVTLEDGSQIKDLAIQYR